MTPRLFTRGFTSLLGTQFLGAANDNVLKQVLTFMIATGIWSGAGGLGDGGQVVPALCLLLPFIVLSGYAGQIADRFSKRTVMVGVKVAEVPIVLIAGLGFLVQNLWITLAAMLLLAIQSTFFGPAKYGVIPELIEDAKLSKGNGLLNMATNVAIIFGSLIAGPIADVYDPASRGATNATPVLWAPGALLLVIALLGLVAVLPMPKLSAADRTLKLSLNPFGTYVAALREMAGGPLLIVTLAWAFFYMIGMIALLIIPEYQSILGTTFTKNSYLLGTMGVAIGLGSITAGAISGDTIRPRLVRVGAIGMTVTFLLLGALTPTYASVGALIFGAGFFAGFYIVPLQALLQHLAPDDERGRFLGTANALSFVFSSVGTGLFWVLRNPLGLPANRIFLACGTLALIGTVVALVRFRGRLDDDDAAVGRPPSP